MQRQDKGETLRAGTQKTEPAAGRGISRTARRQERVAAVVFYFSVVVAVLLVVTIFAGAVAFFAKTFFHIEPRWLFGLFD